MSDNPFAPPPTAPPQLQAQALSLHQLLKTMVEKGASDLHITTGTAPQLRIDGELIAAQDPTLGRRPRPSAVLFDPHRFPKAPVRRRERARPVVRGQRLEPLSRQHLHAKRRGGGGVPHYSVQDLTTTELNLPQSIAELTNRPRGLVLVTGPTGSGKDHDTCGIDRQAQHRDARSHPDHRRSDRVHSSAQKFGGESARDWLGYSVVQEGAQVRPAPRSDVVLVGEMRDLETVEAAMTIARNRSLVLRHAAHQLGGANHQPHHRCLSCALASTGARAAIVLARSRGVAAALAQAGGRQMHRRRGDDSERCDSQSESARTRCISCIHRCRWVSRSTACRP